MRAATRDLNRAIQSGEVNASRFTAEQLDAICAGNDKVPGFTWHHHEAVGRMQLVPEAVHKDPVGPPAMGKRRLRRSPSAR
jgi:filamentous hemagglutinin